MIGSVLSRELALRYSTLLRERRTGGGAAFACFSSSLAKSFKEVTWAYGVLSDPEKRGAFDRAKRNAGAAGQGRAHAVTALPDLGFGQADGVRAIVGESFAVEAAARNHLLKRMGVHAARAFTARLDTDPTSPA